jgi:Asp-tRNA(Asn)/Glu-tRNA(Gln) amidotransferase A subunit family amidase
MTILEASQRIRRGEMSPVELVRACLGRIDAVDPQIRAWVVVDREAALSEGRRIQRESPGTAVLTCGKTA